MRMCIVNIYIYKVIYIYIIMETNTKIKKIFDQFDRDKDGYINKTELNKLAIALNNPLSPPELQDLFRDLDIDKSGKITWEEFIKYWIKE